MSSKNKPKRFCISTNCGLGHGKKVFDLLSNGSYYIIEPAARGGGLGQTLWAFLEPPLPRAAAEYSPDNKEVLQATNSMEGWLSLFRYLIDAEARGDGGEPNPELAGFAYRAHKSAFKMPLRDNSKRSREEALEFEPEAMSPTILGLQDAIMGIQGELGVRYPDASYATIHGGLKNLEEDIRGVQEGVDAQLRAMLAGNQVDMGALKFDTAQASARSMEVKR